MIKVGQIYALPEEKFMYLGDTLRFSGRIQVEAETAKGEWWVAPIGMPWIQIKVEAEVLLEKMRPVR